VPPGRRARRNAGNQLEHGGLLERRKRTSILLTLMDSAADGWPGTRLRPRSSLPQPADQGRTSSWRRENSNAGNRTRRSAIGLRHVNLEELRMGATRRARPLHKMRSVNLSLLPASGNVKPSCRGVGSLFGHSHEFHRRQPAPPHSSALPSSSGRFPGRKRRSLLKAGRCFPPSAS
jgi:hypothetical protein